MTTASNASTGMSIFSETVFAAVNTVGSGYAPAKFVINGMAMTASYFGSKIDPGVSTTGAVLSTGTSFVAADIAAKLTFAAMGAPAALTVGATAVIMVTAGVAAAATGYMVSAAYEGNWGGFKDFVDGVVDSASQAWADAVDFMEKLGETIGDMLLDANNAIEQFGDDVSAWADQFASDVWNRIQEFGDTLSNAYQGMKDFLDGLQDDIGNWIDNLLNGDGNGSGTQGAACGAGAINENPPVSPLILDLDDTGELELSALEEEEVWFDMDADGFRERTGWTTGGDGFLCRDLNGNGKIDNINELFGNATTDGFVILDQLDSSNDNKITSADSAWNTLRIWRDANSNGVTDVGELKTLAEWGITSINSTGSPSSQFIAGHKVSSTNTFTMNGNTEVIKDIWFNVDRIDSQYILPDGFTYHADALELPNLKGYGHVADLHIAMTQDAPRHSSYR